MAVTARKSGFSPKSVLQMYMQLLDEPSVLGVPTGLHVWRWGGLNAIKARKAVTKLPIPHT